MTSKKKDTYDEYPIIPTFAYRIKRGTFYDFGQLDNRNYSRANSLTEHNRSLFVEEMMQDKQMKRKEYGGFSVEDRIHFLEMQAAGVLDLERERTGRPWTNELEEQTGRSAMGVITPSIDAITSWLKSLLLTDNLDSLIEVRPSNLVELQDDKREKISNAVYEIMDAETQAIFDAEVAKVLENMAGLGLSLEESEAADIVDAEDSAREVSIFPGDEREDELISEAVEVAAEESRDEAFQEARKFTNLLKDELEANDSFKEEMKWLRISTGVS